MRKPNRTKQYTKPGKQEESKWMWNYYEYAKSKSEHTVIKRVQKTAQNLNKLEQEKDDETPLKLD